MTQQEEMTNTETLVDNGNSVANVTDLSLASTAGVYEIFTEHGIVYEVHLERDILENNGRLVLSLDPNEPDELEGRHPLTIVDMMLKVGEVGNFSLVDLVSGARRLGTPLITGITKIA